MRPNPFRLLERCEDGLDAARGVLHAVVLVAAFWIIVGLVVWIVL